MKKNAVAKYVIIGIAVIVIGIVVILLLQSGGKDNQMVRIGQIEMREYDVASKVPGRLEWIKVDEGDYVDMGQQLFKLTDREVKAKVAQAQGAVESAKAQYDMALNGARKEEISMAEKALNAAKSQFVLADKTYKRMKTLHDEKLISDQELDVIYQKYSAATAAMEASSAQYEMAVKGARIETKDMARGQYDRASQAREEAMSYLDETVLYSPIKGIVAKRYIDAGELVSSGYPVLTIIDPNDVWAELNLPSQELEKIKIGSIIKGKIHGIGRTELFKVANFAAMADFANWRSTGDKATFDVRSFTVKLIPVNKEIFSLRPGMTVSFDLKSVK